MNKETVRTQLIEIFKECTLLEPKEFVHDQKLDGLVDSMTRIELMTDIEDHFHLDIENGDLAGIETFDDIVDLVVDRLVPADPTS